MTNYKQELKKLEAYFSMSKKNFKKEEINYHNLLSSILNENIENNFNLVCELIKHIPTIIFSLDFEGDVVNTKKALDSFLNPNFKYIQSFNSNSVLHTEILTTFIPEWFSVHRYAFDKELLKKMCLDTSYHQIVTNFLPIFDSHFSRPQDIIIFFHKIFEEKDVILKSDWLIPYIKFMDKEVYDVVKTKFKDDDILYEHSTDNKKNLKASVIFEEIITDYSKISDLNEALFINEILSDLEKGQVGKVTDLILELKNKKYDSKYNIELLLKQII